jgi:Flp pilus assembly protein CpaB
MAIRISGIKERRAPRSNAAAMVFLGLAFIASALLIIRSQGETTVAAPIVGGFDLVSVPVPVAYVPAGTAVSQIKFKQVQFARHQIPEGALTNLKSLESSFTIAALPANLPLFRDNFDSRAASLNPVIERIPTGMRAMTINADAVTSVEGWAGAGAVVDVLLVESGRTTVVAEQVMILSAERSTSTGRAITAPSVPRTVTLLVTQDQCLAINTAIPLGKISFALRSVGDREKWRNERYSADRFKAQSAQKVEKSSISGVISFEVAEEKRRYALVDGRWIASDVLPEGFLLNEER